MNRERLSPIAVIATWLVLILAVLPAEQAQGVDQTSKEGYEQSLPVAEKSVIQGSRTQTAGSGEAVPQLPDPSVTKKVTVQPTVTGVFPQLLSPGKEYALMLKGKGLTQQIALDFGPGIIVFAGSLKIGGPEGLASVTVQVAPDAKPGMRVIRLAAAPGQPFKVQRVKLAVFVEPVPRDEGPIKATPLK